MQRPDLPRHLADFLAPGWVSPGLGKTIRVLIGTEIIFLLVFALSEPLFYADFGQGPFPSDTPIGTLLGFAVFGIILVLFHGLVFVVHKRGVETMLGPLVRCWQDYKRCFKSIGILAVALCFAPPFLSDANIALTRSVPSWLFFALIALPIVSIQALTEEVIYRGYLMQQLATYRPQRWVWMGIPSILFGAAHYFNGFGPSDGIFLVIWATLLGFACADLTARTGTLGAAVALHAVNNLFVTLYVGVQFWPASGLALHLVHYVDPADFDQSLSTLLAPTGLFEMSIALMLLLNMWLAARVALRR